MSSIKNIDEYLHDAVSNIENDRAITTKLLMDLVTQMSQTSDKHIHKDFGEIAAKYLETLQRSNEQLVKVTAIVQRRDGVKTSFDSKHKDDLFDIIAGNK